MRVGITSARMAAAEKRGSRKLDPAVPFGRSMDGIPHAVPEPRAEPRTRKSTSRHLEVHLGSIGLLPRIAI